MEDGIGLVENSSMFKASSDAVVEYDLVLEESTDKRRTPELLESIHVRSVQALYVEFVVTPNSSHNGRTERKW